MDLDPSEFLNPLPDQPSVIETLIGDILSLIKKGGLEPGDRLPSEKTIIKATKASRPSVREALRALKTMGIVESRAGAGSFVKSLEPASLLRRDVISFVLMGESLRDILEARKVLECEVARLAAQRDLDELTGLEKVISEMRSQVSSSRGMFKATWTFHMTLAELCGNPVMAKLVRILYAMIHEVQLRVYWPNIDLQEELESHERLYMTILQGEKEAELEMRNHIDRVARSVHETLRASVAEDTSL